ncbi:MAG: carboxypeptidase-like regulatory domain-containing protein [Bacteroidetes bacterium]|nr:carboxypeptidase-like regulatory domain-containing protein [Bacteroidota bacterium]
MINKFLSIRLVFVRSLPAFVLLFLFFGNAHAQQSTTIAGVVTEAISGQAAIGANVILYEDSVFTKPPFRGATTNRYGFYSLPNVPIGEYFLIAGSWQ